MPERDQIEAGIRMLEHLPLVPAPDAIWISIESALARPRPRPAPSIRWPRFVLTAAALIAAIAAGYWSFAHPSRAVRWDVVRIAGSPMVGSRRVAAVDKVAAGEWIETDARSSASVQIGSIGSVEIAPNTRLRVLAARPGEHRLALARGEIQAKISAPPRLFFVETASGTAVDLGCEYKLNTDEQGFGLLRVTKGWVSFQWKGLESLVPAGAMCPTIPGIGPGIPYFEDAPDSIKQLIENFGLEKSGADAIGPILAAARVRDTLTLWHLLWRVDRNDRERIVDRMAALTPMPAGVDRRRALDLDPETLNRWREELAWTW
jgi:hypothetical protein